MRRQSLGPLAAVWIIFTAARVFAHDRLETSATVYLRGTNVELRVVMLRKTVMLAAERQGIHLVNFSIPSELEDAMPVLRAQAAGLVTLNVGTNVLRAAQTNVLIGAEEEHVGFNLVYLLPANSAFRLDAKILGQLPPDEPFAVNLTALDMVNNKVVTQQLIYAASPTLELSLPTATAPVQSKVETHTP